MSDPEVSSDHRNELPGGALGVVGIVVMSAVLMGPAISLFFNAPVMAGSAGAAVPLVFLVSMVGILFTAYSVAQYSAKVASAGSFFGFVRQAAGPRAGFLVGWCTFGAYLGAAMGGSIVTGAFLSSILEAHFGIAISYFWTTLLTLVVAVGLSIRGIKLSERFSIVMLSIEVVAIVVVIGAIFLQGGADGFSAAPFDLGESSLSGIRLAMVFGVLSFAGFEISASLAEETRNPLRSVPIAVLGCTLVIGLIYIVGSYGVVIGYGTDNVQALATDASSFDTLAKEFANPIRPLVDLILINSLLGAVIAIVNSFARVAFALGREGLIPSAFGATNQRFRTPHVALLSIGVAGTLAAGLLAANGVDGLVGYSYVSTPASLLLILVFIMANTCLWRFYLRQYRGQFSVLKHVVVPALGSLVLLVPLVGQFYPKPPAPLDTLPLYAAGWIVLGVVLLVLNRRRVDAIDAPFVTASEEVTS
ncbi:APC family permease [Nocardioides sp. GXZ039]|uniref:APC family permease n=1 Tax=Nocardioides sp. GXZ039 TaxID=3136018 RepID=UPI0030F4317F